jgi:ATP-dependent Lon protease
VSIENRDKALSGKSILLVDDCRMVRETVRDALTIDNHTVVEANNGAEAFCLFGQQKFDLVVTDGRMPFVPGNELAAQIRRVAPDQRILMLTGYADRPNRNNPVNAVLYKPFNITHFRSVLAELL